MSKKSRLPLTLAYYLNLFCLGLSSAALGPTLLSLGETAGVGKHDVGDMSWLFIIRACFYTVGAMISGYAIDKGIDGHCVLFVALLVAACTLMIVPVSSSLLVTFLVFGVNGLSNGTLTNVPNILLLKVWRGAEEDVSPYMQGMHFCFALGATVSLLIANVVVSAEKSSDYVASVYNSIAVVFFLTSAVVYWAWSHAPPGASSQEQAKQPEALEDRVAPAYGTVVVACILVFIFFYVGTEVTFGGLLWTFCHEGKLKMSKSAATRITMVYWGSFAAGRLLSIPASRRFQTSRLLDAALGGVMVSCLLLLLVPGSGPLWFSVSLFGLCNAPLYAGAIVLLEGWIEVTGVILSAVVAADTVGEALIPAVAGQIMAGSDQRGFVWVVALCCLLATLIYLLLRCQAAQGQAAAQQLPSENRALLGPPVTGESTKPVDGPSPPGKPLHWLLTKEQHSTNQIEATQ